MEETKILIDLTSHFDSKIEQSWQVFVTVNTVIFGWLISKKARHDLIPRVAGVVAYAVFASLIFLTLSGDMLLFEAAYADLRAALEAEDNFLNGTELGKAVLAQKGAIWLWGWKGIYFGCAAAVAAFIFADILHRKAEKDAA